MMSDEPGTAWDVEALEEVQGGKVVQGRKVTIGAARDIVILRYLKEGDTRPFADWIMFARHIPSRRVLFALAVMTRADNPGFDTAGFGDPGVIAFAEFFPLGLKVTGKGMRKSDLETDKRNQLIVGNVERERASGLSRDKAVKAVAGLLAEGGHHISEGAVDKIYKDQKRKARGGTNSR